MIYYTNKIAAGINASYTCVLLCRNYMLWYVTLNMFYYTQCQYKNEQCQWMNQTCYLLNDEMLCVLHTIVKIVDTKKRLS